jgi:hypothetical protein
MTPKNATNGRNKYRYKGRNKSDFFAGTNLRFLKYRLNKRGVRRFVPVQMRDLLGGTNRLNKQPRLFRAEQKILEGEIVSLVAAALPSSSHPRETTLPRDQLACPIIFLFQASAILKPLPKAR